MASRKRGNKARARAAGEGTEGRANDKRDAAQTSTSENAVTPLQVALYWPNIIGYYRFVLLLAAMAAHVVGRPGFCIIAWFTSCALDFFDGIAARAFNQCSKFGELLDVILDNMSRTLLWLLVIPGMPIAIPVISLIVTIEWLTMASTHAEAVRASSHWKSLASSETQSQPPWFVRAIFANGFKNPFGALAIGGGFLLPMYLYCAQQGLLPAVLQSAVLLGTLFAGRLLALVAELYFISRYLASVVRQDAQAASTATAATTS